ncbi:hypothetical protein SAMN05216188_10334 [Lentzea xinjiangensis]|uniref:Uncharacterized protein n=1 Tax=Lentzea xinjiangensis TaxID=402600 RepID=A0A1H9G0P6_9PSEU|nr:hypothetical protein [Lentzea xinjiangensis]SEQ43649.1 hypothetical protein SAMN05216188_10334 [Lentzea xinjiangensis]
MKWYADRPVRLTRQLIADLLAAGWVALWIWVATTVHDWVLRLRAPGDGLVNAGGDIRDVFTNAANKARDVPLVGDDLAGALGNGTKAGETLTSAGHAQIGVVEDSAFWLAAALVVVPVLFLLVTWLPVRLRYALRAGSTARLRDKPDLLALRALTGLSARELARFAGDPAVAWRTGDTEVIDELARRQLAALGVRA